MPKISVIVPVYNAEKYIDRCVKSILAQTFKEIELILVDDGSPDGSPQLCDELQKTDDRIVVIHKKNGGASSARNAGIAVAQGEYIAFVDSDDWIEPQMYQRLYELIDQYDADMVVCNPVFSNNNCEPNRVCVWNQSNLLDSFFRVNGEEDTHIVWNRLMKKKLLENFRFIENKMNEDVHACYFFAKECDKAVYTNESFYHYTFNEQGVTNSKFTIKKADLLDMWEQVYSLTIKYTPEYEHACEMNFKRAYFTLLSKMYIDGYDRQDVQLKEFKKYLKKEVRSSFWDLMKWKMPISRKVLLVFLSI